MHILFDFDGTLVQSQNAVCEELGLLFDRYKRPRPAEISVAYLYQMPMTQRMRTLYFLWRHKNELTERLTRRSHEIPLTPGMAPVLQALHGKHPLSIVSSNNLETIHKVLSHHSLPAFVEIQSVKGIRSKASTLSNYMRSYFLDAKDMLYITDDYRDLFSCHKLHIPVIAVSWGFSSAELLASARPTALVHTPQELLFEIEKLQA